MDWPLEAAALAALDDDEHVRRFQELVRLELPFMTAGLDRLGLRYAAGRQFYHGGRGDARAVFQAMQQEHVIVRPLNGVPVAPARADQPVHLSGE